MQPGLLSRLSACGHSLRTTTEGSVPESRPGAEEGVDGECAVPITNSPPPPPMPPRIALASLLGQAANSH